MSNAWSGRAPDHGVCPLVPPMAIYYVMYIISSYENHQAFVYRFAYSFTFSVTLVVYGLFGLEYVM